MIEVISRSNKKLKQIQFSYNENVGDRDILDWSQAIGKFPYVVINGVTIESTDMIYLKLYNNKFFPELEMTFRDPTNKIHDSQYPLDQQIVSILIKANSEMLMPIRMDFYITSFNTQKNKSGGEYNLYALRGILNVRRIVKNYSINDTSYNALKKIADIAELGFASNILNTNDKMVWLNTGVDFVTEYVHDIVKHSYMNDGTFLWAYIDFYYNLNYVDIEKQLRDNIDKDRSMTGTEYYTGTQDTMPLILSNHPDKNSTNLYIDKYNLMNDSTDVNFRLGYNPQIIYYDNDNKDILNVNLDTISDRGLKSDQIVMKGQPDDNNYLKDQEKNYYIGKVDSDNVHENFIYSILLNEHNLNFLQKIKMNVVLKNINYQLYRFQKVKIEIYKLLELDDELRPISVERAKNTNTDRYKLNERLSGEWLITGINYTFKKGNKRNFIQEITLVRRELSNDNMNKK